MRLRVLLPTEVFADQDIKKVVAEAENGSFCLLPRHIDFVAALVPGLLTFQTDEEQEVILAVDEGILVKCGQEVFVSTRHAVRGPDLGQLRTAVEKRFKVLDGRERAARSAVSRIEASFVRRFLEIQQYG